MDQIDKEPLISVIVPVYNVERYLKKCVDSIVAQTYRNLEIILVDDGSTDRSGEICDELSRTDDRIRVIHKENGGLSSARNAGLDVMSGEFVSFIDSDDFISEDYIKCLHKRISEDGSDMVISGYTTCDEDGNSLGIFSSGCNVIIDRKEFWDWVILGNRETVLYGAVEACPKIYKKAMFHKLRFPVTLHEDEAILYDVIDRCSSISILDGADYHYTQRTGSIMHRQYSVARMESSDIFIKRSLRFLSGGYQKYAECSLMTAAMKILEGINCVPDDAPGKKELQNLLLRNFKDVGSKLRKKSVSWKFRIKSFIFSLSPKLFQLVFNS